METYRFTYEVEITAESMEEAIERLQAELDAGLSGDVQIAENWYQEEA